MLQNALYDTTSVRVRRQLLNAALKSVYDELQSNEKVCMEGKSERAREREKWIKGGGEMDDRGAVGQPESWSEVTLDCT